MAKTKADRDEAQFPRTRTERLLMELLFQVVATADASDSYVKTSLRKAGFSEEEVEECMYTEIEEAP